MDAMAPLMTACFDDNAAGPDLTPYQARPATVPLDRLNPKVADLKDPAERQWAEKSLATNFAQVDRADEDTLNRILWHAARGTDTPYPAELAGAHGRGLKARKLILLPGGDDDDDDDEKEKEKEKEKDGNR
jgi:hypothetical protein